MVKEFGEINYNFKDICHLLESQLNVCLDEPVKDRGLSYNNPIKIKFNEDYFDNEIETAIYKLFDLYPVLKARVVDDEGNLSFIFDSVPEVKIGSIGDLDSFVRPFDLEESLSRFLIIENESVLCIDCHHLIFDGTSLNILLNSLLSILNNDVVDFVDDGVLREVSFEDSIDSSYLDDARDFFDGMLAERDEVNDLLASVNSNGANEYIDSFDVDLSSFLKNNSITYNQFFATVFAYTLSRFTGSDKVMFNLIEDGRGHIDLSNSVGMFVKTLPVLIDCNNQDIRSFVKYSSGLIDSAMKYDLYPFRVLVNDYDLSSDISFQYNHDLFNIFGLDVEELGHDVFNDLNFLIQYINGNNFEIKVSYSNKFSNEFIKSFVQSYKLILKGMLSFNKLNEIDYISSSDLELLNTYNNTDYSFDYDDILDAFNDNLKEYEDKVLVGYEDKSFTFGEGAFIANEIAGHLEGMGLVRQDFVALFVERSEWFLLASLGVLSMGGVYVPIDTNYPDERIVLMLKDTGSKVVIVTNRSEERMRNIILKNGLDIDVLNVDGLEENRDSLDYLDYLSVDVDDVACVLYTSGTTGTPKGVLVSRKAINNFVSWYVNETNFTCEDVYGMHCSYVFDMHVHALYSAVVSGGSLYVVPEDIRLDLNALNDYFVEHGCTHTYITSQVGKLFAESGMETTIKLLCFGGMKLGALNAPDSIGPFESYGPSENLAISTSIFANDRIDDSSIGYFVSNVKGYVLDGEGRRVPLGAVGELYLSGAQLTKGYLNRDEENSKVFFDNAFDKELGYECIYKTGDMVRFLPDGSLGIVGRRDSQVKIRGNRVELGEVESVIRSIDFAEDVTVQTVDNNGNNELVAYVVVSDDGFEGNLREFVCDFVANRKPDYMVPSYVVGLDEVPLTVNGKVDKGALPEVDFDVLQVEYVAPRNDTEGAIVDAFEKVFGREHIGVYDDFIVLGGDSLSAIKLLSYLDGFNISAGDVLSLRTPSAIASSVDDDVAFDLDVYSLDGGCPLNESQLNVYLDIKANDKRDAYLIPLFMNISGVYGVEDIRSALGVMFDVHPVLSMCVSDDFDVPYLIKGQDPSIIIESGVNDDFITEFLTEPFDLYDSLSRFLIVEDDGFVLYGVFHHIIFDAMSEDVFKRDLLSILDGSVVNLDDSFLKASAFNQQISKSNNYTKAEEFYDSMLDYVDYAGELLDSVLADGPGSTLIDLNMDNSLLNSFLDKYNISENVLFSGVFAYTLSRFVGSEKVLFNIVENGRDRFGNFDSIGMFVNTLPLLVDCKNQDIGSFMDYVSNMIYGVMRYNYYPFRLLANKYDIKSDIIFQFLPEWVRDNNDLDETIKNVDEKDLIEAMGDFIADLSVEVIQRGNDYLLSVVYSDKYSSDFIDRFVKSYKLILNDILGVGDLCDICYVSSDDLVLLDDFNGIEHGLVYEDVLDAFNANLVKCSDNDLVLYNGNSYSYGEGAFIADKVARSLSDLGVNTGDCVGFLVPRSELYMFSVLGILSCGGVYVPLDDDLPDERLSFILEDCACKVVIVSDDTEGRLSDLEYDNLILNISNIMREDIGCLDYLPIVHGDLACVLYTSGTTGVPKGVKVTRKSLINVCENYIENYGLDSNDVYGLFSAIGFDMATFVINVVVCAGGCLAVIPDDIKLDMLKLNEYFVAYDVSHVAFTTQVGKLFMESVDETSLDVLHVGGEKLGDFVCSGAYRVVDGYGPTESFAFVCSIDNSDKLDSSSVGFVNSNVHVYVLDNELRRVPVGAVGELFIGGYQLADGYLNRDDETSRAFVDNIYDDTEGFNRLYRTGDLVRFLPDGSLGIVGRRDGQVKVRGNRVELSEVEAVIRELDCVDDVTVQTVLNGSNYELVAYVVSNEDDKRVVEEDIRDFVLNSKPDYMVPSFIVFVDFVPLTVNGKVDKGALPEVDVEGLTVDYVAPRNSDECLIVDAFERVLNRERVGVFDDFVRLGGDSISAIRVISLLQNEGVYCSARDMLKYKTPSLIAQNIEVIDEDIVYDVTQGEVGLLPIQSFFFDEVSEDAFSQHFVLKCKSYMDLDVLERSLDELFNVHDMLRAVYREDDEGGIVQEVLPVGSHVCDVNEYSVVDFDKEFNQIFVNSVGSLDIHNKLVDVSLVHCGDEDYVLFVIHHLIVDGVSWNIILDDLTYIYNCLVNNRSVNLLRPYPYKLWVEDVKVLVDNISVEEKEHWSKVNALLDDFGIRGKGCSYSFNVDFDFDVDNLFMLSEEECWALAIARAYKKTYGVDVIFNRESYGRDDSISNLNQTVGWFTSQYPVLVNVSSDYDNISFIQDVYSIKKSFNDVNNLGLNYQSLIYITGDLEYKHCHVSFNFLSDEFVFENDLFESVNGLSFDEELSNGGYDDVYGIDFNISKAEVSGSYVVSGSYASDTYIGDKYQVFVENIKDELEFIEDYDFDEDIICYLSESQMGVYLDEVVNDKDVAYSTRILYDYDLNCSVEGMEKIIYSVVDRHPILKGRILNRDDDVFLVCDSYPLVEVVDSDDISSLVRPFDLEDYLARFYIIDTPSRKAIFIDLHHIISDATTLSIINKELDNGFEGTLDDDGVVDLGFVRASYDDFISKFDSSYENAHVFFADELSDVDSIDGLMDDVDGSDGSLVLPIRGIKDDLESFAYDNGVTVGNLFYGVFAYCLSRFTGGSEVCFNITEHGRHVDYVEDSVGMFVRTVPLVVDCKDSSVEDFVGYVSDLVLESIENSVYPFRLLASEFNLNNHISFEYNYDLNDMSFVGDDIVIMDYALDTVSEFSCVVNDLDDGYAVSVNHSGKYSPLTAKRFVYAFKEILTQLLDKDNLGEIDYISSYDLELLDTFNDTEYVFEYDDILDVFNDNLKEYEDNVLVGYEDKSFTFGESAFIANEIAGHLEDLGVARQDFVALFVERSEWFLLSCLGVLSMGGVYVPIDMDYPDERIVLMLKDTGSKVVLVSDETEGRMCEIIRDNGLDIDVLNLDGFEDNVGSLSHLDYVCVDTDDLACVLYTSGTTGTPKGVLVTRWAVNNFVLWYVNETNFGCDDVYGMHCSYVFDIHTAALYAPVVSGGSLYVVPEDIRLDLNALNDYFVEHGCTHTYITSQVGKLFAESGMETTIKLLCFGGMKLGALNAPDSIGPFESYGPSENLAISTSIFANDRIDDSSIGYFVSNVKGYVLDGEGRRVPLGAVGELYLSGAQLTKGYLNRDEENSKVFFDNAFDKELGYECIYKTGDMVRFLPDGSLGIVGRRDSQVKIRGNRVELGEVESVIRSIDFAEDVTVQTVDNNGNNELVAYVVVSDDGFEGNLREFVCDFVANRKPDYMVPSYVVRLDEVPLTVNGKVDIGALPEIDFDVLQVEYVAPRSETEEAIVDAFERVFGREHIGVYDDFVVLGGDSLSAIKLLSYLDGFNISAGDVLSLRTPSAIASSVDDDVAFDLDVYSLDGGCPLNESQLNVYLDIKANDKRDAYLIPLFMNISGVYGVEDIRSALGVMFDVHPVLGMCVSDDFDVPYLVKGSNPSVIVESSVSDDFINEFLLAPFDLYDSLCRFLIVEIDGGFVLYGVFHHIIFDALSEDVFKRDLLGILNGEIVDVDDSFLKVSAFSQQIAETKDYTEAEEFYESMLADVDDTGELLDSVLADGPGSTFIDLDIDNNLLNSFLEDHNISENVLFSSVFAYTLSRFVGSDKVLFNIVENGRDRFNNFDSVGMFVNTLPLLVDCENRDIGSFMDYVSGLVYGVMRYNYYPFRLLANKYDIRSDILFQFLPDWVRNNNMSDEGLIGVGEGDLLDNMSDLIANLNVSVIQKGNDYILSVVYCDKYSGAFVDRFVQSYNFILNDMLSVKALEDISYISSDDLVLLDELNDTEHVLAYDDVLEAFNDNLSRNPDNMLVSYRDCSYTYGEGAFIADKLVLSLKDMGVEEQDHVAFLVERSELYMFCVLGILSCGGVYVPLDENLPDERIKFMLNDTESKVVIVSDETYNRAVELVDNEDVVLLNISHILNGEIGSLSNLSACNGDLACILYTSGTTGTPKGVKITRKSLINVCEDYIAKYDLDDKDVYGLYASIGFDVASFNISVAIYVGACLSVVPEDCKLDMYKLNEYFIEHSVNHTWITTPVGKLFIQSNPTTSLDILMVGGDKLGEIKNPDDFTLIDVCGPTEAFEHISSIKYSKKVDASSIGHLNYNTKAYVLDDEGRRVPFGVVGELYISSYQLADGYLNRDEETNHAFIDNPYDNSYGFNRLYRTGDRIRFLPDGSIGFVGRRDSQVKIRGNRVELSEVEAVIRELDYVEDVTVQVVKNGSNLELIAYVVSKNVDLDGVEGDIRAFILDSKPDYMVPSYILFIDEIPLTVNGKVDKRALPEVDLDALHVEYVAPRSESEKLIVGAFELVFNQEGIGLYDDFVRLGGDSIGAIRVVSLLEKDGVSCSARDILDYKTPYLIAQNVVYVSKKSYDATVGEVDLLPIQSYFFDQINRDDFSQEFVLKSKVVLDLDILQCAFDELCDVHDMLRASYNYDGDGGVVQEVLPLGSRVCDVKEYVSDDLDKAVKTIIDESKRSLDICGDLVKISLVHCDEESYVIFVIHHLIIDGVSWSILIDDLSYIINQIRNNNECDLLRPYPYRDWVCDVKSLVDGISDDEWDRWFSLNGLLDDSSIKGESKGFSFGVDVSFDLDNLFMLSEEEYLALCIARAYKRTYGEDIIFNRESYGRDDGLADVSRTLGWFTSQFPVLVDTNNGYDIVSLMCDVYSIKEAFRDVDHLGLNYGSLIYTMGVLEYKHCPVTFNFLSGEFSFENDLFEAVNYGLSKDDGVVDGLNLVELDGVSFGVSLNVSRMGERYVVGGDYACGTYLGDKFDDFVENIRYELSFIAGYEFDNIVCCLSEAQLGVYLDEKVHDKGTAYAVPGVFECDENYSVDEIKGAIHALVDKHPILKGRVVESGDLPFLVCDSYPEISVSDVDDYSELIRPFDLGKCLARFFIVDNDYGMCVVYDMHHMISDASSRSIVDRDLDFALAGELDDEVDLGFVYASRDSFESQFRPDYDAAYGFFRDMFVDIDEVSSLLDDVGGCVGCVSLPIRGVREDVLSFVRGHGITVSSFLNAVFAYTCSRFVGGSKVCYNFTENGRHEDYSQDALGMFVRTVPVLVDCSNRSVGDFLSGVSDLILDAMGSSVYPFRLLAGEFGLSNSVGFEYNYDLNDTVGVGDEIVFSDEADRVSDLFCVVNDLDDGFLVSLNHLDNFSQDTAERFVNVFREVLVQFLDKETLDDIVYISNEDVGLLDVFNDTGHVLDYVDVLDAFNDNLSRCPGNLLVSYEDCSYTYGEGAFIASRIAESLIDLGVVSGDCVGFLVPRSELYMFSVLGILSCGGVYVPLDDDLPDERLSFILDDSDCKAVIVSDDTYDCLSDLGYEGYVLNVSDILGEDIGSLSYLPVVYGDLACILYTSGSTGVPKGVKVTRKSLVNVCENYIENYGLDDSDVYGLFSAIGFDMSSLVICVVMCAGACLDVVPRDIRLDMLKLNEYFIIHGVTHTIITTQVAKLFMEMVNETSLDILFVIGEKLGEIISPVDYCLVDAYGPTESIAYVSAIDNSDKVDYSSVGFVNFNVKFYVLDDELRRVPIGAVGELYIAGYQLADGYLNREEETNSAFILNPFDDQEGYECIYKTGDLVRFLPDGSLGFVGRRDSQLKIRGNRVELGEVESVIRDMDIVEDVTVQTIENNGNIELIAYLVTSDEIDGVALLDCVRDYVGGRKPGYMVPSYVVGLDDIPLTVNGKVDKGALPEVDVNSLSVEYVAPINETETLIVDVFEDVFNQKGLGLYDDFVRLGGDSIAAIRVVSLLESNGVSCSARDILNYKTPYLIAQHIDDNIEFTSYDAIEGVVDLLPIQSYFFDQVNLNNYTQHFVLRFNVDVDASILQKSLDELINLHDMLRAVYRVDGDNVVQEVLPINSHICDINEHNIEDNFDENMRNIFVKSTESINIENKLIDVNLIHYNDESYLMLVIHHLIVDGVSWNILLSDLTDIYYSLLNGESVNLLMPYPYKLWVDDVKNLVDCISDSEKQYWIDLNGLLDDSLIRGQSNLFTFDVDVKYDVDNLLILSEEEYLALAISRAYKKTYGEDIIFNRESYGREDTVANLNRTIGWFTSQYPVHVSVDNGYDDVSLMSDVYKLKMAFEDVDNLGLNYTSLIYSTGDLVFKHCPVTFNFLNTEFVFKNDLFESINNLSENDNDDEINIEDLDSESYGITFNISRVDDSYVISGDYAEDTYLGDKIDVFFDNIKDELMFIANYEFDSIVCCLSEAQLGVYLDEKVHDKGTAYSVPGIFECTSDYSVDQIKTAIHTLIDKHPILKGRVVESNDLSLLVCDSYPEISVSDVDDYSELIRPFDLGKCLARFFIVDNNDFMSIVYDMHHMISDATSRSNIDRYLSLALCGELDDEVDLGFVYASRDSFESQFKPDYDAAYGFFRDMFADIDEVSSFLDDVDGCVGSVSLPICGVRDHVLSFVRDYGITVSSFLNAVFAYTYSRFVGGSKVCYNFTENGRHEDYSQDALGMFVRTVPVLVDCSNRSVGDFLSGVSDLILDAMGSSVYPFRLLAGEFGLSNSVGFEYNYDLNDVSSIGDGVVFSDEADTVSDFLCVVNDLDDGFLVSLNHLDKFSQDTAERFVNVFREVLVQFLDKEVLSDICYVSNDDVFLLDCYNDTSCDLDYVDVLEAFNDNLLRYPDNILVSYEDCSYTYVEGAFVADKVASSLKDLGVEMQDKVAFLVERSELYMFCVLGILSCGGVYVPLDDKLNDERIKFMLEDTDCDVVIVSDETYNRVNGLTNRNLLNISKIVNGGIGCLDCLPVVYGDLACILYTSGSTGVPKGVNITRKSLINVCENYIVKYGLDSSDVYGLFSSIGFDMSSFIISVVLCVGACLAVVPEDIRLDMLKLNEYFISHNVSHTIITTQVAKLFMESVSVSSLDILFVIGEKLGEVNSPINYRLIDAYGPTESIAYVSAIDNNEKLDYSSVGFANGNVKFYILDDELRRVPFGAVGELFIGGYQLADGYLNRDEQTNKMFIPNPYDKGDYGVLYRTGDVCRFLPDGSLGIVGRRDSQVKIRGNRVELGEVESVIRDMDIVEDVTVQTIDNDSNNELVAYVVLSVDDFDGNLMDFVCDYVADCKPDYMVPSYVVRLDEVPLTVNGKVDKGALPEVDVDSLSVEYVAPSNEIEKAIVSAFEIVFNRKGIGLYDDFVRLGGDSISAIRLISLLEKDGISCRARDIFNAKTPYNIAKLIDKGKKDYGFVLAREGTTNQNMFLLPPAGGLSMIYNKLINDIDFEGNIYIIDDYQFELTSEDIKKVDGPSMAFEKYWGAIKDIFQDDDILVGYSFGCIHASLLCERLEKNKKVYKCVLIDGTLNFVNDDPITNEELSSTIKDFKEYYLSEIKDVRFIKKSTEVFISNLRWNLPQPKISSHVIYLATSNKFKEQLDKMASDYEFINIDSTHVDIMGKDLYKIIKYLI